MSFNALRQTNQKLSTNPELSEHNKEVLNEFFRKARSGGASDSTLRDYASRFNKLAEIVEFDLDKPSQRDLEEVVSAFNIDEVRKNNGEKYSDYSKDKFWSTLSKFYRGFIKKEGKGYNPNIDGPELLEDLEISVDISTDIDPDRKPTPEEVKKVANHAKTLRDRAIILFSWATGARIGEVFITQDNDTPLKWKDLEFREDKLWVELVDGKTGKRTIPVKTSMPVMRELWENVDASTDDPVFTKERKDFCCPKCAAKVGLAGSHCSMEDRDYSCKECEWKGGYSEVEKELKPLTDHAVRRVIEKTVERAGLEGEFDVNPHDFGRKSRAIYKARIGWSDHQLRGFFGWAETSDAPKHYLQLVKEDLEKALAEEFGEKVDYDNGYDEEALRPIECVKCGTINSPTSDLCNECSNGLTEQGEELTNSSGFQDFEQSLLDLLKDKDPASDEEEITELMNKSFIEVIKELQ